MRFRGMAWRPILEMSAATVGLGVVLAMLASAGVLSPDDVGWAPAFRSPACLVMLLRLDMYTGRSVEDAHPGRPPLAERLTDPPQGRS
jgi:hypothetical protein